LVGEPSGDVSDVVIQAEDLVDDDDRRMPAPGGLRFGEIGIEGPAVSRDMDLASTHRNSSARYVVRFTDISLAYEAAFQPGKRTRCEGVPR
jgi:hypothetical protein